MATTPFPLAVAGGGKGVVVGGGGGAVGIVPELEIDWFMVASNLFGGMALFLYGMKLVEESLVKIAGKRLRGILSLLSTNKFIGVIFGFFATALLQSSTITTVMLVRIVLLT